MNRILLTATLIAGLSSSAMAQSPVVVRVGSERFKAHRKDTANQSFSGTPLLQGFKLEFIISDSEIKEMGILHKPGAVIATYTDYNSGPRDQGFTWWADFLTLKHPDIVLGEASSDNERGHATALLKKPRGDFVFVLRGFFVEYTSLTTGGLEHHVDQIGIFEKAGKLHVALNDKNNDDTFAFRVQYAYVPKSLIRRTVAVTDTTKGEQIANTTFGTPVICGFFFNFKNKDHQLRGIGVDSNNGNVKVSYFDKNRDDTYRWNVTLAVLRDAPAEPTRLRPTNVNVLKGSNGLKLKFAKPIRRRR